MSIFIFEKRPMKKSDSVSLIEGITRDSYYGVDKDFLVNQQVLNMLKKFASIMYIYEISKDGKFCKVQTKKTQGKKYEMFVPCDLFNIIKVPKMNDIVQWLYDNQPVAYPEQWRYFPTEIQSISRYVVKIFQTNLKAIYLANKYCNHLYFSNDVYEVLMFYKTIVQQLKLSYHDRYAKFNQITIRKSFIDTCLKLDPTWHQLDAIALYDMNNQNVFTDDEYISNVDRLDWYKNPSKKFKAENTKEKKEELKKIIAENEAKNNAIKVQNDNRFLKELNQQVIDDLELVIFNVKTLPNRNQILFIFIDKDNNKRFFVEQFNFVFYVSNKSNIVENDYLVEYDETIHTPFIIQNYEVLRNLKFAVNDNHKRFMKNGKF